MMAWARYLMLVVFENFLQFFFRFSSPLCSYVVFKKKKKMPVGGETSQVSHTLKKKKKKKKIVVGGQVTQFRL